MGWSGKDVILGFLVFAFVFTGGGIWYLSLSNAYGVVPSSNDTGIYGLVNNSLLSARGIGADLEQGVQDQDSSLSTLFLVGKSVIAAAKLPFTAVRIMLFSLLPEFVKRLGIPLWIKLTIESVLLIVTAWALMEMYFRYRSD